MSVSGNFVYAASGSSISRWDGSSWTTIGTISLQQVSTMVTDSSGNLYVAGGFTAISGVAVNRIAKYNGTTWSAIGAGINIGVNVLRIISGNLYAGGPFTIANNDTNIKYIAKITNY